MVGQRGTPPDGVADEVLPGGSRMGLLMRSLDWSRSPLGPVSGWPQSLRSTVSICLGTRFPSLIWWGPELLMLYNDACWPLLGARHHPGAVGQRGATCWPEVWPMIGPLIEQVRRDGHGAWSEDQRLLLAQNGSVEERVFTFSHSPICDESGGVGGVFTVAIETTGHAGAARPDLRDQPAPAARDASDHPSRTLGAIGDMSRRNRAEEALRDSEERFRAVQDVSRDGCVILSPVRDPEGRIVDFVYEYANAAASRMLARSVDQVDGRRLLDIVPGNRGEILDRYARVAETGEPHDMELPYHLDGLDGWWRNMAVRVGDKIVVSFSDITARKRAEESREQLLDALERAFGLLEAVLRQMPAGVLVAEASSGKLVLSNDQAAVLWGHPYMPAAGIEESWKYEGFHPDGRPYEPHEWPLARALLRGELVTDEEIRFHRRDGTWGIMAVSAGPVRDSTGTIVAGVSTLTDITARKRVEESLKAADRRKNEFLATLAHELRNPLAPIRNAVQLLRLQASHAPEILRVRDIIDRQVDHLTRLVDDLLDVSRITRNQIELYRERVELSAIVERALETSQPILAAGSHALRVVVPAEPIWLDADVVRASQVLSNLLNNAAKYTPSGGNIELVVAREGDHARIHVRDDGIGMPPEMLSEVFDMFIQLDTSLSRTQGGLGVGLTIVKQLVEMHGGSVEATSAGPGLGSQFTVRLPIAPAPGEPGSRPGDGQDFDPTIRALRILVVDDNRDSAETLAELLRLLGHEVRTAYHGRQALERAGAFLPDVVLLDIGLPGLDGYEVAGRLRQEPGTRETVLIALTGWGQEEDRRRTSRAGFDHHLIKPVDLPALREILASCLAR